MSQTIRLFISGLAALFILLSATILGSQSGESARTSDAELEKTVFPARGEHSTVLHTAKPGRYHISVKSAQGTAIAIIDRMAGQLAKAGNVGDSDGRLDLILDKGSFLIQLASSPQGSGNATLTAKSYSETNPGARMEEMPWLQERQLTSAVLHDLEQRSWWLEITQDKILNLEIMGRCLRDARLWKNGSWLEGVEPTSRTVKPHPSQPMTCLEFHHRISPGLYLLTCYGGPAHQWTGTSVAASDNGAAPLHLRLGFPILPDSGLQEIQLSPFGKDYYLIPANASYFQLIAPDKATGTLGVGNFSGGSSRETQTGRKENIVPASRRSRCSLLTSPGDKKAFKWVSISGEPGQRFQLIHFSQLTTFSVMKNGRYWISTLHSEEGRDSASPSAILKDNASPAPVAEDVVRVTPDSPLRELVNLTEEMDIYLFFAVEGTYMIHENPKSTAKGQYRLDPVFIDASGKFRSRGFMDPGEKIEVLPGYYCLTIQAKSKGYLHFEMVSKSLLSGGSFSGEDLIAGREKTGAGVGSSVIWPDLRLSSSRSYTLMINRRPEVASGVIARQLPMDLNEPLPLYLEPGQEVEAYVSADGAQKLVAAGEGFELTVNDKPWTPGQILEKGTYSLKVANKNAKQCYIRLGAELAAPVSSPLAPVIKPLHEVFPVLTEGAAIFSDYGREEQKEFLLRVSAPGLYRLETVGRLATSIVVRTLVAPLLTSATQNGVARNALVQQFLRPGDYLVTVRTEGKSAGRAGLHLHRTPLTEMTGLAPGLTLRSFVPRNSAIRYEMIIPRQGEYEARLLALDRDLPFRLEDKDGWPLFSPLLSGGVFSLSPGVCYLYSLPEPVDQRRLASLAEKIPAPHYAGPGPHTLLMNMAAENTWMEEPGRPPHIYRVNLTAPAEVILSITEDLHGEILSNAGKRLGVTEKGIWSGLLPMGGSEIRVSCREKNNNVDYKIVLKTDFLIPGLTQSVSPGSGSIPVSVGEEALIELSSFGAVDVRATLRNEAGEALEEADDFPNDWNFTISRKLTPGLYSLELSVPGYSVLSQKEPNSGENYQTEEETESEEEYSEEEGEGEYSEEEGEGEYSQEEDEGSESGGEPEKSVFVRMTARTRVRVQNQIVPFALIASSPAEVMEIPFTIPGPTPEPVLARFFEKKNQPLRYALWKGKTLLAEGENELFIPLAPGAEYTFLAWNTGDAKTTCSVSVEIIRTASLTISSSGASLSGKTAFLLSNPGGGSFTCEGPLHEKTALLYSPRPEQPCLPVLDLTLNTVQGRGWLASSKRIQSARMISDTLVSGVSREITLSTEPLSARLNVAGNAPMLLDITSFNGLAGMSVLLEKDLAAGVPPEETFQRNGLIVRAGLTRLGLPGSGSYRLNAWMAEPRERIASRAKRDETGSRVAISAVAYPVQETIDFTAALNAEAEIAPGKSALLKLPEAPIRVSLALAHGLLAFSRRDNQPLDCVDACRDHLFTSIFAQGGFLYLLNTGDQPARFRAIKKDEAETPMIRVSGENPFIRVMTEPGELLFRLPGGPDGGAFAIAGAGSPEVRFWNGSGRITPTPAVDIPANFSLLQTPAGGGWLEIRYGKGPLMIWRSNPDSRGAGFTGTPPSAAGFSSKKLTAGVSQWPNVPQILEFRVDAPAFIMMETRQPAALALESSDLGGNSNLSGKTLCLAISPHGAPPRLLHYLPAGLYHLRLRPFGPENGHTELLFKAISPMMLTEGDNAPLRIISPGETHIYRFNVRESGIVGVGLKTDRDLLEARLYNAASVLVSSSPLSIRALEPGEYILMVESRETPVQYRPVLLGANGGRNAEPPDEIEKYKKEAGQ